LSCYDCISVLGSCDQTSQCPTESTNCFGECDVKQKRMFYRQSELLLFHERPGRQKSFTMRTYNVVCSIRPGPIFPPVDPSTNAPNGKTCYSCDGQSCLNTVSCSGTEDQVAVKGCASKSICDVPNLIPTVNDVSCCSGNLCNGAQSVTQSFLFLCCSLLSFILLH
uniref:Uncharacterized protein n=1 Tax=Sinocyclocheilus anshuiensis TaxID=1608454 RepID=A0A671PJ62_9TELE